MKSTERVSINRESIDQVEALGVLCKNRLEISAECHIPAHEHSQAAAEAETQSLVVRISNTNGKSAILHLSFKIEDAEHFHAIGRDGEFFIDYADVAEA